MEFQINIWTLPASISPSALNNPAATKVLLVQAQLTRQNHGYQALVDCARHIIQNKLAECKSNCCIAIVLQIPRIRGGFKGFMGLPGFPWQSLHIDQLRGDPNNLDVRLIRAKQLSTIIEERLIDFDSLVKEAIPQAVSLTQTQRVQRRLELIHRNLDNDGGDLIQLFKHKLQQNIKTAATPLAEKWMVRMVS